MTAARAAGSATVDEWVRVFPSKRAEISNRRCTEPWSGVFELEESAVSVDANDGYGFPSGHVAAATAFCFGLVFLFGWRWGWWLMAIWVPLVAISRMYMSRHFLGDVLGGVAVGIIAVTTVLIGLAAARLDNPRSGRLVARRVVLSAAALAAFALWIRLPGAYDAGKLLGIAIGTFFVVRSSVTNAGTWGGRIGRMVAAALLFVPAAWATARVVAPAGMAHDPVGALLAGALPTAILLIGPVYLPRTVTLTRYSPLLSGR